MVKMKKLIELMKNKKKLRQVFERFKTWSKIEVILYNAHTDTPTYTAVIERMNMYRNNCD